MNRFWVLFLVPAFFLFSPATSRALEKRRLFLTNLPLNMVPLSVDLLSNSGGLGLDLSHKEDLNKYRWNKKQKSGRALRTVVPIGAGIALIFISGPVACLPVGVGVVMGIRSFAEYHRNKKVRGLLDGALLFLSGYDRSRRKEHKEPLKKFYRFYQKSSDKLRQNMWPRSSDWQLMTYLASRLLLINHYGFLVANRFNRDQALSGIVGDDSADSAGKFTSDFLSKNVAVLCLIMEDIFSITSPETLERISFGVKAAPE